MINRNNRAKDAVAIAAATTTGFSARNTDRTPLSYAVEASMAAIRAAGLTANDVDGIVATSTPAPQLQRALGIPEVTYFSNPPIPFINHLADAVGAVHSGICDVVLAVHTAYRLPWNSGGALKDPFRRGGMGGTATPESINGAFGYTAWPRATCTSTASGVRRSDSLPSTIGRTLHAIPRRQCANPSRWTSTCRPG